MEEKRSRRYNQKQITGCARSRAKGELRYAFCRSDENGKNRVSGDIRSVLCAGHCSHCRARYIVFGAIKLVGYFSRDLFRLAFQYDLAFGILLIALGIVTLARPGGAMSFLCIVFGIPVLADGLFKIQISLDAKRFGIEKWWVVLLLAALTCVIGLLLVIRPSEAARALMVLMGISLLLDGILNMCVAWLCVKIVRNQRPDALDEDYEELKDE